MERLPGGVGVMMDDVLAGIYSNLLLRAGVRRGYL
ncbi:MAG: phosphatidylglycerophosphatase A [Hymenobacter sp.]